VYIDTVRTKEFPRPAPDTARSKLSIAMNWKRRALRLQEEARVLYFVVKHRRTPWYARLVAASATGYLLSPIQLLPNFIPVIGCLDDLLVLFVGIKLLQRFTPADVLSECREFADAAAASRKQEIRSAAAIAVSVLLALVWLLAAVMGSAILAAYIYR
jgi:uncharacterized membrane protein YkvA (DUF1232 family)